MQKDEFNFLGSNFKNSAVRTLELSIDERYLYSAGDYGYIFKYNLETKEVIAKKFSNEKPIHCLKIMSFKLLSAGED